MFINHELGELNLKLVYYGPAFSGKTTNLEFICAATPADQRTNLVSLKTRGDRTLFFDYVQIALPPVWGLKPRFNVYTVPGQVEYAATRRVVLQDADGVVFVADSQPQRMAENLQSLVELYWQAKQTGLAEHPFSLVVQFNKRDLADAMPAKEIQKLLGVESAACFEASALNGQGVLETLHTATELIIRSVQRFRSEPAAADFAH